MLYILPPPRAPNPPSPWDSILCTANNNNGTGDRGPWDGNKRTPRSRLRNFQFRSEDGTAAAQDDSMDSNRNPKSLSECYFAGKGTALVLPAADAQKTNRTSPGGQRSNIQKHLQSMFYLLRPEETLKMAVKLESAHPTRTRYLVVVSRMGSRAEESCLLGIDCNEKTTVGLVLKVMADTTIRLDGDGGFSVSVCGRHHIFKPVSVQAMWSALQTLHKVSSKARQENYYQAGLTHGWVNYYEERIESDRSCLNEWHAMDNLESKRPPSPDSVRTKPRQREETERVIKTTLKEIMMSVDLDEVTSKYIRSRLEEDLDMDLGEYKSFIDQEMLTILGQMDAPTEIFDHVYLGSEWNASNYEELQRNGVGHILNVTREIDNFFPGTFDYLNVRVYDDEKTDLLKHWDDTFKYITKAKMSGSKVLVHCKMGVSRSASVVIAYAMKAYNWDFQTAMCHVKEKRTCIKPNTSFLSQLETYQGILDAMKNKEKLQRSKSETNLKSPGSNHKTDKVLVGSEPTPVIQALSKRHDLQTTLSGQDLRNLGTRPKSWSPDNARELVNVEKSPVFLSLEDLSQKSTSKECVKSLQGRNVLMPCDNGESYSVSPNRIVHLPGQIPVRERVSELESNKIKGVSDEKTQTGSGGGSKKETWDPGDGGTVVSENCDSAETVWTSSTVVKNVPDSANSINEVPESLKARSGDPFSNQLDKVFDREEKKQQRVSSVISVTAVEPQNEDIRECPSRQSSWSSYDSAVVLGGHNDHALSRHSSWGSGDTRVLPSRNSSWGSYDMRPRGPVHYVNEKGEKVLHNFEFEGSSSGIFPYDKEDIPWHPGTVKRTKQRIEENNTKNCDNTMTKSSSSETLFEYNTDDKTVEAVNKRLIEESAITIDVAGDDSPSSTNLSRLSVSAPESSSMDLVSPEYLSRSASNVSTLESSVINTAQCSSVKQHRSFLENLRNKESNNMTKIEKFDTTSGIVRNLKKEFEAKTGSNLPELAPETVETKKNKVNSLPTSPVSLHQDKSEAPTKTGEDLNFKNLLGLFENNKQEEVTRRPKLATVKPFAPRAARYSCIEVSIEKSPIRISQTPLINNLGSKGVDGEFKRPPMSPVVRNTSPSLMVAATVIAKAAKKQQQFGKSHPLARLNIKPRHNSPVYNTM